MDHGFDMQRHKERADDGADVGVVACGQKRNINKETDHEILVILILR